jgi:hypothetical protein
VCSDARRLLGLRELKGAAAGAQVQCDSSFDFLAALRVAKPLLTELQVRAAAPQAAHSSSRRAVHACVCYPNPSYPTPSLRARARQAGAGLRLLLIDNMAAFYWQDRAVQATPSEHAPQPLSFAAARPHGGPAPARSDARRPPPPGAGRRALRARVALAVAPGGGPGCFARVPQ